ncbi:MAG: response regulator transcription factor [Sandaracinaceae bacterium]
MTEAPTPRILLVEDDPSLALGLCDTLEFEGFEVKHARTGQEGIASARNDHPDCIILDLMLPDTNGYKVCEQIRRDDPIVPIIMLTARSQETDKIRGLDAGADDYVTKPFSVGELVARIRAIFRRMGRGSRQGMPLSIGDATIDPASQVLTRGRQEVKLSFYEVELLKFLHERAGQPVTRDELLDKVWGIEASPNNRTVDNFVVKLRKKIEPQPDQPRHILTVYGVGYKLVV